MNDTKFAPVIRISGLNAGTKDADIAVIVAQWHPALRDTTHQFFVRGVPVSRTTITQECAGRLYRWCVFPGYRVMLVNEGNLTSRRLQR